MLDQKQATQLYSDYVKQLKVLVSKRAQHLTNVLKKTEDTKIEQIKNEIDQQN